MSQQSMHEQKIAKVAVLLIERLAKATDESEINGIVKAVELKALYAEIPTLPADERAAFGQALNDLKVRLENAVAAAHRLNGAHDTRPPIDVTAPFDVNVNGNHPKLLPSEQGSMHPLMRERQIMLDIFYRMGFTAAESRELDDDYHMFTSLNFPAGHPARDDYDTFMTEQTDTNGNRLVAPAHTSTMQNRLLQQYKGNLEQGKPIAVVVPDRVFRNEDLDARHEHTFYQCEGVYVDKGVHAGMLMATIKTFLEAYYQKELDVKTQPFYFPFTEPSFEFSMSCPFCDKKGCSICGHAGWIEIMGCGMVHPNVLKMAGIDPDVYTGFAWGVGIDRLVMMKYGIEDVRHFQSGKLEFLKQFGQLA